MAKIVNGYSLPNIPWQPRPENDNSPIWRYENNPIIGRHDIPRANSIFNSAVVPYKGEFAGVFRCDDRTGHMDLYVGHSKDGVKWDISNDPIVMYNEQGEVVPYEYRYDPRVLFMDDKWYVTWCNGFHGPTIGVAYTTDFVHFTQLENAFLPFNRNGVLFPRKINGRYMMMSRPSDNGHTPFGDIYVSQSSDLEFWGHHRWMMGTWGGWQSTKVGPGPVPIETDEGWLMIYHGVITTCNGFVYRISTAILDKDEPWKVLYRSHDYLMGPETIYECTGDVPNVVFPCALLVDQDTGRITMYYGCADTVVGMAFTTLDELIKFTKEHS